MVYSNYAKYLGGSSSNLLLGCNNLVRYCCSIRKSYFALIASLIVLLFPLLAFAAITQDATPATSYSGSVQTYSITLTTTNINDLILVSVGDQTNDSADVVTGAKVNGSSMTLVSKVVSGCTNTLPQYLFSFSNSTTTTNLITVTSSSNIIMYVSRMAYHGSDTTNGIDTYTSSCDNDAPTPSLTSTVGGDWYFSTTGVWNAFPSAIAGASPLLSPTNSQSQIWDSGGSIGVAGTYSFAYTSAANSHISHIDTLIKPAATVTSSPKPPLSWFSWWF